MGTKTSKPTEPEVAEMENSGNGSLGVRMKKSASISNPWFMDPCILAIKEKALFIEEYIEFCKTIPIF